MPTPAVNTALIVLGVLVFVGLICWLFKTQVGLFAKTLLNYRQKVHEAAHFTTATETV